MALRHVRFGEEFKHGKTDEMVNAIDKTQSRTIITWFIVGDARNVEPDEPDRRLWSGTMSLARRRPDDWTRAQEGGIFYM